MILSLPSNYLFILHDECTTLSSIRRSMFHAAGRGGDEDENPNSNLREH